MKKSFTIPVTRIGYAYKNMEVEANSLEEAEGIALDNAGDEEFSERESDYILPDSSETFSLQILLGETAHMIFNVVNGAITVDEIKAKLTEEYGNGDIENKRDIEELECMVQTKTFNSKEEMNAFLEGFQMSSGYLEATAFIEKNKTLKVIDIS
jgi:hypothetical protein